MEAHNGGPDSQEGRIRRLYDRLAAVLKGMRPERLEALEEHLNEQDEARENDQGRPVPPPIGTDQGDGSRERHDH